MRAWPDDQSPMNSIGEITGAGLAGPEQFLHDVVEPCRPVIIRGLVGDWPVVAAGTSPGTLRGYLRQFDTGGEVEAFFGAPPIGGKYYYGDGLGGFNFERRRTGFGAALDAMVSALGRPGSESIYMGSLPVDDYLPGFAAQNPMPLVPVPPRIWLGHASDISAHYDTADNLACVVAGMRRFTLYAPDLIAGCMPGPSTIPWRPPVSLAASSLAGRCEISVVQDVRGQALVADLARRRALPAQTMVASGPVHGPLNGLVN